MLTSTSPRNAVRAVLLDPERRILLFCFHLPPGMLSPDPVTFWGLPGGAMEPGEDPEATLRRELFEEAGLTDTVIGPELWFGSNEITLHGQPTRTRERFFLVEASTTRLDASHRTAVEHRIIRQHRWWSARELLETSDTTFPPRLGYWLDQFLRHGTAGPREIPL